MRKKENNIRTILYGILTLIFLSDAGMVLSQTEVLFSTNPAFMQKKGAPKYHSVSAVLDNGSDTLKYDNPTITGMETEASLDAAIAHLIKNPPNTTVVWDYKPQAFTISSRGDRLVVYQRMNHRNDSTVFYYDSLNRVNHIHASTQIWYYDAKNNKGSTMDYGEGYCYYDTKSRIIRLEEKYTGDEEVPELYINWYCHYQNDILKYYLRYESLTKTGKYKLSGVFVLDYSDSPKPPSKKKLRKEFESVLQKNPPFLSL